MHDIRPVVPTVHFVKNEWFTLTAPSLQATVHVSRFVPPGGAEEIHLHIQPRDYGSGEVQLKAIEDAYEIARSELGLDSGSAVFRRVFSSDLVNHAELLGCSPVASRTLGGDPCAVSWIGQAPVPDSKLALWAYHLRDAGADLVKTQQGESMSLQRGGLTHHWSTGLTDTSEASSYEQTADIIKSYNQWIGERGMTLADNVIRTWLFVKNIDADYRGLVVARRELFAKHGLTPETHYLASSGIEGGNEDVRALVSMDSYAIEGIRPEQVEFLNALDHLGPTDAYGVTFERGTSVAYRDRKHLFLSGTASIDPEGAILHPGDVGRQLERTLDNMNALLADGGGGLADMCHFTVYLRDSSDQALVRTMMRDRFPDAPMALVKGPVCRPGWLIELEGVAVVANKQPGLPGY